MYLKACFSKELSEVCSHDSLQEPPQGDDVGVASCPGSNKRNNTLVLASCDHLVTVCDIL